MRKGEIKWRFDANTISLFSNFGSFVNIIKPVNTTIEKTLFKFIYIEISTFKNRLDKYAHTRNIIHYGLQSEYTHSA